MNESAALQPAAVFPKKISLKSIRFIEETNPRQDIVQDRVSFFQELFQDTDHSVPPLEVLLVQGGDPKSAIYVILDGIHRYEALRGTKASEVLCNVHTEPAYTLSDIEEKKVIGAILEMSCIYNVNSPLPLTRDERIAAAMRFKDLKYTHERISKALSVPLRTVYRWLEDTNREHKEQLKTVILEELGNGAKINELVRKYKGKISEFTIMRWKKEVGKGVKREGGRKLPNGMFLPPSTGRVPLTPPEPLFSGKDPIPGLKVGAGVPGIGDESHLDDRQREEIISKLVKIYDVIRTSEWFGDADDYVITNLLPLLSEKSAKLKAVLSIGGYGVLYEEMESVFEDEKKKHAETTATSLERQALIEDLQGELRDRRQNCRHDCSHSKEWVRKELRQSLGCHLKTLGLLKAALLEGQITNPAKKVIHVPGEARQLVTQLAMNAAYLAISHFEWAKLHDVHSPEEIASFYDFLGLLDSFEFSKNKDIVERVRELDQAFPSP
jgi:Homeodomain-like domain